MADWFTLTRSDNDRALTIEFQPSDHRYWPPEILRMHPLISKLPQSLQDWHVTLTGPAPVWMYAHGAAVAKSLDASNISVKSRAPEGTSTDLSHASCEFIHVPGEKARGLFHFHLPGNPGLTQNAILDLITPKLAKFKKLKGGTLCISGKGNMPTYALIAETAVAIGIAQILCWTPVDGLVTVFDANPEKLGTRPEPEEWLQQAIPEPEKSTIVGITGDPNCGKSVFSSALNHYRGRIQRSGWRLDCDGQAPTTDWYLNWRHQDPASADAARKALKRDWNDSMEDHIAQQLRGLRRFFEVAIADLPGGNHKHVPALRVPPHREVIFHEVDVLILIERIDQPSESLWREALRPHGMENQIRVVLRSAKHLGLPSMTLDENVDGIWRGTVTGLDRSRSADELVTGMEPTLEQLWKELSL